MTPSAEERLIREFVLQLKLGRVAYDYFRKKFGVDPGHRFAQALGRLKEWGMVILGADEVVVQRHGLLQIDRLLQEFFLPEHRNARYA